MNMNQIEEEVRELRQMLHQIPEFSMQEKKTKEFLMGYLQRETDLEIVDCGPWFYAKTRVSNEIVTEYLAFRADFDAVAGADGKPGHYCGHDGHSAILAGFAKWVSERLNAGHKIQPMLFLFQPAEETGEGAALCREIFEKERIRDIYGFHNIPGFPLGSILIQPGTFACASTGLEIRVKGTPSHAAYPEAGRNPAEVIAKLILYKEEILESLHREQFVESKVPDSADDFLGEENHQKNAAPIILATVIGVDLGSSSYGVSASEGVLRLTLRAEREQDFQHLVAAFSNKALELAEGTGMECEIRHIEPFPATENHPSCVEHLKQSVEKAGLQWMIPEEPFRWSEDFGAYLQVGKGAMFGVGDGEEWPQLHTVGYEFPDSIIHTVLCMYAAISNLA